MRPSVLKVKKYFISFITHQAWSTRYGFLRAVTCSGAKYTEPQFPVYRKGKWCHNSRFNFFHWCLFSETMSRHGITTLRIHTANKTRILHNCIIFLTEENLKCIKLRIHTANKTRILHNCIIFLTGENLKCIKLRIHTANKTRILQICIIFGPEGNLKCINLLTSTLKLEAEICFEGLVTTDKIRRHQYEPIRNTKCT